LAQFKNARDAIPNLVNQTAPYTLSTINNLLDYIRKDSRDNLRNNVDETNATKRNIIAAGIITIAVFAHNSFPLVIWMRDTILDGTIAGATLTQVTFAFGLIFFIGKVGYHFPQTNYIIGYSLSLSGYLKKATRGTRSCQKYQDYR